MEGASKISGLSNSKKYNEYSNVLISFMSEPPSHFPIFHVDESSREEKIIASQLINDCTICFNKILGPSKPDNCLHIFCKRCIKRWRKISSFCPVCRKKINYVKKI